MLQKVICEVHFCVDESFQYCHSLNVSSFPFRSGKPILYVFWKLSVEKMWAQEKHPYLAFESPQCDVGQQLNICCSEAYLPASTLPFALNRHWRRFNICWAKPCTPVFLFLHSSEPEPPPFSFPPCLFPPRFRVLPFSFYYWHHRAARKASLQQCTWHRVSQGHQSHCWVFTVGQIKVLVLRLTLKDVGFTLGWWLWLSRLGLNELILATCRHYTTLGSFT